MESQPALRILAVADVWQGSNAYAFVRAFRRMGHSVTVVPSETYVPSTWSSLSLRAVRRLLEPAIVREYAQALTSEADALRPHLLFVYKGRYVTPQAIDAVKELGTVAVNFFPDVSVLAHGSYIPAALPHYDWVFTTKTFGIADMKRSIGVVRASVLPHGYDPEVHRPVGLAADEVARYGCDVSFIGTWSPKKRKMLEVVADAMPDVRMRIWGSQWEPARSSLGSRVEGRHVLGIEYAKALVGSSINIAILSETRPGASSGDHITSRTFHIPATGSFMLHERTDEFLQHFVEGKEAACFASADELVERVRFYLEREDERRAIAAAGLVRVERSSNSIEDRAACVLSKFEELRAAASRAESR